jgi:exonuclease SbcC
LLNRLQKEIITRKNLITKQEERFKQILTDSCFSSSQEFLDARIASQELNLLQELHNKLQRKKAELKALHKDKEIALQLEKARQLTDESAKELKKQIDKLGEEQENFQEKAISAKERLKANSTLKTKSKKQIATIVSQKNVVGRWNRLHMLIGSADGKKFRNFAQGLTFEMMVHHANAHLQTMNNRYILIRDLEHPLDLNVIDTYQADEIRSTKNLSGGESFLVSLALALGLSKMSSQNVRVDSLFLDEGFGTLDEDALESALDTLAGLRDENKLIGIISHVAALKQRIPLQIEIIPEGNGNSSIKGPGVTREIQ